MLQLQIYVNQFKSKKLLQSIMILLKLCYLKMKEAFY